MSGFSHLAYSFWSSYCNVSVLLSFLLHISLYDIPHFIYLLLIYWYLGCFHLLAIVNSAVMSDHYEFLFKYMFSVLSVNKVGVKFLGHMVMLWLIFWGTVRLFFYSSCTNLHSLSNAWGFWFLYLIVKASCFLLFLSIVILVDVLFIFLKNLFSVLFKLIVYWSSSSSFSSVISINCYAHITNIFILDTTFFSFRIFSWFIFLGLFLCWDVYLFIHCMSFLISFCIIIIAIIRFFFKF